jgi:phosphoglycolate phosphatase-like HAD superfamily hydrolase
MRRRLVLFDIDGTLVTDGGASRAAFASALADVYGYTGDVNQYDFSGRTDPQIAFMLLGDAGISETDIAAKLPALWNHYLAGVAGNIANGRVRALDGIPELVAALAEKPEVTLALLTGNLEKGARLKLTPPDLNRYFSFGAFGSDSSKREELPPIAAERASHIHRFAKDDIVIIGDSIYDVRCGVPHGATTIAVASGKTSGEKLRAEKPTFFFESAADEGILDAILSGVRRP